METGASSCASRDPPSQYDVFLSFRGEDTRDTFTCHLYEGLRRKKIETFIDDRLNRGEEISSSLLQAIEESKISLVIFSENYASSSWCLDELAKILECMDTHKRVVIPIFYNIDPSNVRNQRGSYADAFAKHVQRFKDNMDKVQRRKDLLTRASNISGWDSKDFRPDSKLVEEIVKDVLKKLNCMSSLSSDLQGLVGVDKHIIKIESAIEQLKPRSKDCRVGIWGIGGIGKTTIARALFEKLITKYEFDSHCFVGNVGKEMETSGVDHIRNKYLAEILEEEDRQVHRFTSQKRRRLEHTKVLLVFDDVRTACQVIDLFRLCGPFMSESIIIVTTRDKQVLKNAETDIIHEVTELNYDDALQLFNLHAFKQMHPIKGYIKLSKQLVDYAKGIPLALTVLGTFLRGRSKKQWENAFEKLGKAPNKEIFEVLKLSYDGLDEDEKDIFLDIACFFKGQDKISVQETLESCGFNASIGMEVLEERGLLSYTNGKIMMHDLIEKMGHQIVQQPAKVPGKFSRLWERSDISSVLRSNKGTKAIQCIFLNMCKGVDKIELHGDPFAKMDNLRLLQFYNPNPNEHSKMCIRKDLQSLPEKLRFLRWDGFPQRCLPIKFFPENLVALDMRKSHLEKLWEEDQLLPNLKRIDLSYSSQLIELPDLSQAPNIEEIILSYCTRLRALHSICILKKLHTLWLDGCFSLGFVNLRSYLLAKSSGLVILYNCKNLRTFDVSPSRFALTSARKPKSVLEKFTDALVVDPMESAKFDHEPNDSVHLIKLNLLREGTTLSSQRFKELCWLDLSYCDSLISLPNCIFWFRGLRRLYLRGCSNLRSISEIYAPQENLTVIILDETSIRELPKNMKHFIALEELSLCKCRMLKSIPFSIGSLDKLRKLDLTFCHSLEVLPSSIFDLKIARLDLSGCSSLKKLPDILDTNVNLMYLCLQGTAIQELPSSLQKLIGLQNLHLEMCRDLKFAPNSIFNMTYLIQLDFSSCSSLSKIPEDIGYLSMIRKLSLCGCKSIVTLPTTITHLSSLKSLDLRDCAKLQSIPELPPFLQELFALDCHQVKRVSCSKITLTRDIQENVFEFHLTNCEQLDQGAYNSIVAHSGQRFRQDTCSSIFFCFPGSKIPYWFPYRSQDHQLNSEGNRDWYNDKFLGFVICVIVTAESETLHKCRLRYQFELFDHELLWGPFPCDQPIYYSNWKGYGRDLNQDHMFLWNCNLRKYGDFRKMDRFTFKVCQSTDSDATFMIKECGVCPLYEFKDGDSGSSSDICS